jgi:hypothetical protein
MKTCSQISPIVSRERAYFSWRGSAEGTVYLNPKPLSLQSRTDDRGGDGVLLAARLALGTAIVWGLFQLEWFCADGLNRNGVPVHDSKSMAILQMFRAYGTHI